MCDSVKGARVKQEANNLKCLQAVLVPAVGGAFLSGRASVFHSPLFLLFFKSLHRWQVRFGQGRERAREWPLFLPPLERSAVM